MNNNNDSSNKWYSLRNNNNNNNNRMTIFLPRIIRLLRKIVHWIQILFSSCSRIIIIPKNTIFGHYDDNKKKKDEGPIIIRQSSDTNNNTSTSYRIATTTISSTTSSTTTTLLLYRIITVYAIIITFVVIRMSKLSSSSSSLSDCRTADTNNNNNNDSTSTQRKLPVQIQIQQQQNDLSSTNRSSNEDNKYNKKTKEIIYAIVHIGPHKTGTTTLQYESTRLYKQLLLDRYELPSTYLYGASSNHYRLAHCLKQNIILNRTIQYLATTSKDTVLQQQNPNEYCDSDYLISILRIASRQNNILLSAERFATPSVLTSMIETVLLPWKPNIYIVAYYRYYYDWFISWHNQIMKRKDVADRTLIVDWIHDINRINTLYNTIYSYGCIKRYQKQFSVANVIIYNIHTPTYNLIRDFFCIVLPNTPQTCQYITQEQNLKLHNQQLKQQLIQQQQQQQQSNYRRRLLRLPNGTSTTALRKSILSTATEGNLFTRITRGGQIIADSITTTKNSAVTLIYEEIAYAMIQRYKLLRSNNKTKKGNGQQQQQNKVTIPYSIAELSILVQQEHEIQQGRKSPNNFDSIYRICPQQSSLDLLWNLTLSAQYEFFPESQIEQQLRVNFTLASTTINALCSLNTTALLTEHPQWKMFFDKYFNITISRSSSDG